MPSLEHDGVVELFRDKPELGPYLLERIFHLPVPAHTQVRIADSSLGQLLPIEFRADLVLELLDEGGGCVLAIVLESQREVAARKRFSWPVYVAVSRAERECESVVMVVAVDADVATWAAQRIDLGLGVSTVGPLVLGPRVLPEMTDEEEARADKELAVLSAMAHGNGPKGMAVVLAALRALGDLDAEHATVYFHIIWNMLREPMQRALEALVVQQQARKEIKLPPFIQVLVDKGFHDGERKGEVKGEVRTLREKIFHFVERRGLALTIDQDARIRGCNDRALLDRWLDNVLDASNGDDVFR
jgi:hypothetical protein